MSNDLTFQCDGTHTVTGVDIELLYIEDCPNVDLARERITQAARRVGVVVELRERLIVDEAMAVAAGMHGSPTVLVAGADVTGAGEDVRSEEHTSELQSLMRISYDVFCLKTQK